MIIWSGIKGTKWEAYDGSLLNKPSLGEATASENMIAIWTDKVFSKWLCFVLFFLLYLNGHRQHAEHFKFLLVLFNFLCRQRVQHLQLNVEIPQRTVICCLGQGFFFFLMIRRPPRSTLGPVCDKQRQTFSWLSAELGLL